MGSGTIAIASGLKFQAIYRSQCNQIFFLKLCCLICHWFSCVFLGVAAGQPGGWRDGRTVGRTDGWEDGRTDGRMDRGMDGRSDGWSDGRPVGLSGGNQKVLLRLFHQQPAPRLSQSILPNCFQLVQDDCSWARLWLSSWGQAFRFVTFVFDLRDPREGMEQALNTKP